MVQKKKRERERGLMCFQYLSLKFHINMAFAFKLEFVAWSLILVLRCVSVKLSPLRALLYCRLIVILEL